MNDEGGAAPDSSVPNGHSALSLVLRVLAAVAVVGVAVLVRDLVEDDAASETGGSKVISYQVESELLGNSQPVRS